MLTLISKYKVLSLAFVSILIGLIWRIEIEFHGWAGLTWITYFHFSVPIGFILFMTWANAMVRIDFAKRVIINVIGIGFAVLMILLIHMSLTTIFAGGPSALMMMKLLGWKYYFITYSIFILIPMLVVGPFLILKLFKQAVNFKLLILGLLVMLIALPVALFLLELVNHQGSHDAIHTIKSGLIFPFWIFAIGLVFITKKG